MATVLHSVTAAKPAACRDCGRPIGDRLVTWDCRCDFCDDARELREAIGRVIAVRDPQMVLDLLNAIEYAEENRVMARRGGPVNAVRWGRITRSGVRREAAPAAAPVECEAFA